MKTNPGNLFIGIDSGGTECKAVLTDNKLKKQFFASTESVHFTDSGAEILSDSLVHIINIICRKARIEVKNVSGIGIGAAGARTKEQQDEIRKISVRKTGNKNIIVTGDTLAALTGALSGEDGFVLICGTGSVLFGIFSNVVYRFGGWGKVLGDQGSGYYIGQKALSETVKLFDRGIHSNEFQKLLQKKFGINKDNIIKKIYHKNFQIQFIAPLVIECASGNVKMCRKIISDSVGELVSLVETALMQVKEALPVKLCLSGSIITNKNYYSDLLKKNLRKKFGKKIKIINAEHTPETGAAMLALKKFGKKII